MRKDAEKPEKAGNRQPKDPSGPVEFAPNSTQPVEAMDKSTQTHNPGSQRRGLQQNEGPDGAKKPVPPGHAAGQHATGSFSGATGNQPEESKPENPKKDVK